MNKPKYIIDTIDYFISGDWGNEEASFDAPNRVRCIRGADINSANENNNESIPTRYISDNSKQKKLLSAGNIIVEKSGGSPTQSTGRVAYISDSIINNEDVVCSNFCAAFKIKDVYDPKYIYYYLKYMYNLGVFFNFEGKTSGIKNLQLEQAYNNIPIRDIDILEQQKIASVLSALDKKIELNNKIIKELETMSKELYDYWFVQFDFPEANGKPYRTSGGAMTYNTTLKREIPLGWEVKTLSSIANITMGQSPNGESYNETGDGAIFYQGCTDFGKIFPTVRQYTTAPSRMAMKGDILMSVRAPVGTLNFANTDCCIGRGLCAMNSKNTTISYLYQVVCQLESIFNQRNSDGTTFGSITKDDLFSLPVIATNNDLEHTFESVAGKYLSKIFAAANENQELTTLRDWLLPMLMNGQIAIK
ncbi:MAG: restriction endonuclease subunit S [bacterium]